MNSSKLPLFGLEMDSDVFGLKLRRALLDSGRKAVLLARLDGSLEASDKYTKINAGGLGRIRIFKSHGMHLSRLRSVSGRRIPLLRGHPHTTEFHSQVFQLAGCNWRCWYCFVDDALLNAVIARGEYITAQELIDLYLQIPNRPSIIDLSGGQPDLVPEWAYWTLEEINRRGLQGKVIVWQDDNLSNDWLWKVLSDEQISFMARFENYSRVGCFKGFDSESFSFNTSAPAELFEKQFEIFQRLLGCGFEVYAYTTFTSPAGCCSRAKMAAFVDRLQNIHPLLPLRTIPIEVRPFSATVSRMKTTHKDSFEEQKIAGKFWDEELMRRFSTEQLQLPYESVSINSSNT